MNYKPSKIFSNGTEAESWKFYFCERCSKFKNERGEPTCLTEGFMEFSRFKESFWPKERIVEMKGFSRVCLDFYSDDEEVMADYRETFDL